MSRNSEGSRRVVGHGSYGGRHIADQGFRGAERRSGAAGSAKGFDHLCGVRLGIFVAGKNFAREILPLLSADTLEMIARDLLPAPSPTHSESPPHLNKRRRLEDRK